MSIILPGNTGKKEDKKVYPVVSIRDGVVYPATESVLNFGRPRSLAAIEYALNHAKELVIVMQKDPRINEPKREDIYTIGTVVKIEKVLRNEKETSALVIGRKRVKIESFVQEEPFMAVTTEEIPDKIEEGEDLEAVVKLVYSEMKRAVSMGKNVDFLSFVNVMSGMNPSDLSYNVASILDIKPEKRQKLLEEVDVKKRLEELLEILAHEIKVLEIEKNISQKTHAKFDKSLREAVLRERMRTIEKELGEDSEGDEIANLRKKIKNSGMPKEVAKKARKELKRLGRMSSYNPEASYLRTYLETLLELPWKVEKQKNGVTIKKAEKVLDKEHYGLKKVKERILEYLAVMSLKEKRKQKKRDGQPTILCFVGPPGVGKTSIGRSISHALDRKFVKISLGGIRDEAEIRGHRRTYVGALPGRIIQGIKQAGSRNPVFMLDEIDKVGSDFRGDPSAALLEALDPEQNFEFTDHYLDVPFDLSEVFFITTCNVLETIPPALRDRLEIIHFPGYTEDEKFRIAKDHLIEKQLKAHALNKKDVSLSDQSLKKIIQRYTREAGVRNLERQIAKIFRKAARKIAEGEKGKIRIGISDLDELLGPYKFKPLLAEIEDEVGMATGLFWTQAGGGILFIEVAIMPGKGNLKLTGQLGDVMKESGEAALSYVRSRFRELGLTDKFYQKTDVHIHVPEGAVKKDGPSAGIAIAASLTSALTNIPVCKDIGMTGEITLRGRVLEIGGVKEKIIAAHSAGLRKIIMPKDNKKDLVEIPKKIRDDLKFIFVDHMDEVLKHALRLPQPARRAAGIPLFQQLPKLES